MKARAVTQPLVSEETKGGRDPRIEELLSEIAQIGMLTHAEIAKLLGSSLASVVRWARNDVSPSPEMAAKINSLAQTMRVGDKQGAFNQQPHKFASRGARKSASALPLFEPSRLVELTAEVQKPLVSRLKHSQFWSRGQSQLATILAENIKPAITPSSPALGGISAGKNTYTYDAHTYHTKVPPQGIAEVLKQYLPEGGVVLDPFSGSGMTGVAARVVGCDVILNELSPAASFISDRFTSPFSPEKFAAGVRAVCDATKEVRRDLYSTNCRECGRETEIQYTVWSFRVKCSECSHDFVLWDHCRKYGRTVREHKILSEFPCPSCQSVIRKSRLERTQSIPVLLGYKCCKGRQVEHPLTQDDIARVTRISEMPPVAEGFFPTTPIPDGVNLRQPKRHGLVSVDKFYTSRNLAAMSHLWKAIHHIEDTELAGFLGFAFTSLYQRVTRLSEFRFWGGSGNTAHFNVPYVSNEANVFITFERKARTIQDHLGTTAQHFGGRCAVRTGSATSLDFLPNDSVDLVFTDPPFGANINYSEMNMLWEAWLDSFTDNSHEVIVNKFQNKDSAAYGDLMRASLLECHRVLRPGHWLILVFMNSSQQIWEQLRLAILKAGFSVERVDIFDKQHGTFKQFVSDNTAGCDLILHCLKPTNTPRRPLATGTMKSNPEATVSTFLARRRDRIPMLPYLHVDREEEIDFRRLYSEWLASDFEKAEFLSFASFIDAAKRALNAEE